VEDSADLSASEWRALRLMDGLGPYFGIFYGPAVVGRPRFGHGGDLFRLLSRRAPGRGLFVYVFTPESLAPFAPVAVGSAAAPSPVTAGRSAALGGWFHDGREWIRARFPWPDVLYDRSIAGSEDEDRRLGAIRRSFPPSLPALNSPALVEAVEDKLRVHQVLSEAPGVAPFLPVTAALTGPAVAREFIERFGAMVIKERFGQKARRVMFARRDDGGIAAVTAPAVRRGNEPPAPGLSVSCVWDTGAGHQEERHGLTWDEFACLLATHTAGTEFIVQRAIDRADHMGRLIELRAVMHRTPGGAWLRTGMVCRLTDPGLPFLALGRELDERPSRVLPHVFGAERADRLIEKIRELAGLAGHLERACGRGAELAVDFLIDRDGRPWLLEVNSRAAMLLKSTGAETLRQRGVLRLLEYGRALAGGEIV
jgi:hypothetical protein